MTIGRKSYIRRSGQATWETQELPPFAMPAGSAGAPVADVESVLDQMKALGNVEQLPDEMIDGVLCARYRLQVEFGRVLEQVRRRLDPEDPEVKAWLEALDRMGQEPAMRMEYWVGKQDHLVQGVVQCSCSSTRWSGHCLRHRDDPTLSLGQGFRAFRPDRVQVANS